MYENSFIVLHEFACSVVKINGMDIETLLLIDKITPKSPVKNSDGEQVKHLKHMRAGALAELCDIFLCHAVNPHGAWAPFCDSGA